MWRAVLGLISFNSFPKLLHEYPLLVIARNSRFTAVCLSLRGGSLTWCLFVRYLSSDTENRRESALQNQGCGECVSRRFKRGLGASPKRCTKSTAVPLRLSLTPNTANVLAVPSVALLHGILSRELTQPHRFRLLVRT